MENRPLRFARVAAAVASRCVPPACRFARPTHAPAALLGAVPLREHLRLTCRGLEDLLRLSGPPRRALGLRVAPGHPTAWWFCRRHAAPGPFEAPLAETVRRPRGGAERAARVALDSAGLFPTHTPRHFAWRAKRDRGGGAG